MAIAVSTLSLPGEVAARRPHVPPLPHARRLHRSAARRQSARGRARRRWARHGRDAGARAASSTVRDRLRLPPTSPGAPTACASSRPTGNCPSPAIRPSERPCCSALRIQTARAAPMPSGWRRQVGLVPCAVAVEDAVSGHAIFRAAATTGELERRPGKRRVAPGRSGPDPREIGFDRHVPSRLRRRGLYLVPVSRLEAIGHARSLRGEGFDKVFGDSDHPVRLMSDARIHPMWRACGLVRACSGPGMGIVEDPATGRRCSRVRGRAHAMRALRRWRT